MVAIVGTRNTTAYGERTARELARAAAAAGACIVSGLARGVDTAAHRGALDAGGRTIAVLGTGATRAYPPSNRRLYAEIAERGLVVSEHRLPVPAMRHVFPQRNRIIAGLSHVVLVVEAGVKSGALNTAEWAMELGRTVAGVPGPIDSPESLGVNRLIRDGAQLVTDIDDLLQLAGLGPAARRQVTIADPLQRAVYDALAAGELTPDVIAVRTGLPATQCLVAITALELAGVVECSLGGTVRRR